jgi:hypothetical protein
MTGKVCYAEDNYQACDFSKRSDHQITSKVFQNALPESGKPGLA